MVAWNSLLLIPRNFRAGSSRRIDRTLGFLLLSRPANLLRTWKPWFLKDPLWKFACPIAFRLAVQSQLKTSSKNALAERQAGGPRPISVANAHIQQKRTQNQRSALCDLEH